MKTWYEGHDKAFKTRKARGHPGWEASDEDYAKFRALIDRALSQGTAPSSGRLLELGCGAGNLTPWLVGKGYEAYGIDISPTAVHWARERAAAHGVMAEFVVGDVCNLSGYADDFFDFVLDEHCFHCIIGDDRNRLLQEVRRVLKPGGYFLVITMSGSRDAVRIDGFDPDSGCVVLHGIAARYIGDPAGIVQEIQDAGLTVVRWCVEPGEDVSDLIVDAVRTR